MKLSDQAQATLDFFIESEFGKTFSDPDAFDEQLARETERQRKNAPYPIPDMVFERSNLSEFATKDNTRVLVMSPKGHSTSGTVVVYYHGGGFLLDASVVHFELCLNLMDELRCPVALPLVPLVPLADCDEIIASSVAAYESIRLMMPDTRIVLAGESAGASLCIAVSQTCREQGVEQPALMVLCSPFIDLTGTTEEALGEHVSDDPMIDWHGSRRLAELYRGKHDVHAFPPDPFYGPKDGLAPMVVFCGTREVLLAGTREFCRQAKEAGSEVDFKPYEGLWHAFLLNSLTGIPECDQAFYEAIDAIRACGA